MGCLPKEAKGEADAKEGGFPLPADPRKPRGGTREAWLCPWAATATDVDASQAQNQRGVESEDEGDEDAVASDLDDGLYIKPGQDVADPFFEGEGDPFSDPFFQGDRENRQAAAGKPEAKA